MYRIKPALLCLFLALACNRPEPVSEVNELEVRNRMMEANRILVEKERGEIAEFIKRHGWTMELSGTGLHYEIYSRGKGKQPEPGKPVTASWMVWLLDGTFCYEHDSLHPVTFMPGKNQQPRGLEEGLLLMPEGSRARLVLPAHLAYGTAGDGNKISGNAALYYDVQLLPTNEKR